MDIKIDNFALIAIIPFFCVGSRIYPQQSIKE